MSERRGLPLALRVVGELVVIVAGVLIALWVDNLNEDRHDAAREASYLSGILVDLDSDSTELVDRRRTAVRGVHVADRLLELRRDRAASSSADSLAAWLLYAAFVDNFQVLDHTYREILGARGLGLIRDESVRRGISAEDFVGVSRSEEGSQELDAARVVAVVRSDPELANAVEMNRHWAALRLGITERRLARNRALAGALRSHLDGR